MQRSKVARLPKELKEELERLWRTGGYTLDGLLAKLREMGMTDVSRSGLGRYVQGVEKTMARYREAQEIAGAWVAKLGEDSKGDVGRLLAEMLKTIAFATLKDLGQGDLSAEPMELMLLSKTIQGIAAAEKTSVDRELKIREKLRAELERKVDAARKSAPADQGAAFERAKELVRGLL